MLDKSFAPGGLGRLGPALLLLIWAVVVLDFAVSALAQPTGPVSLGLQTRAQIEGIQEEKAARSPAIRKLDSQLIYALRQQRFGRAVATASALTPTVQAEADGRFTVDIDGEVRPALLLFINQRGGEVLNQHPRHRSLRALVPLELVETLAVRPEVRFIRPAVAAHTHAGAVVSEGDAAHQADSFRAGFLATGAGVKIGVLSDSANYYEDSRSRGELPEITILPGAFGLGTGEGTAMMEIIHDLAPESELYFATAFGGVASFADNIRRLYEAGCRIIVDDVIYFNESPFQDGPIAQAVNDVSAGGALYFSSAGNEGNLTHSTSGTWEGDFNDAGPVSFGRGGRIHSFGSADYNTVLSGGGFRRLDLFWADPLGQSTNDYDLYVVDANGNVVRSSTNIQDGQQDPYEWIGTSTVGERVVIVKYSGDSRFLHLGAFRERLAFGTTGSTRGHNASGAPNAFCVAATRTPNPPTAFVGGTTNPVESFSSNGPRRKFFHPDGQPITPGDFSSTGGMVLQKPDLTAADGVATSVPGFGLFLGTSAAAPHAAAIAALLWSYNPALTPEQIRDALTTGVLDIEAPGWDRDSGAGIPMLPLMINLIPAPAPRLVLEEIQFTDADGSGALNAGECAEIRVVLRNLASTNAGAATGVTAVLTSATAGLLAEPIPQDFPEVSPGGVATHVLPFRISSDSTYICWRGAELQLQVTSDNAGDYLFSIPIGATTNGVAAVIEYQATDVPLPIPDFGTLAAPLSVQDFTAGIAEVSVSVHVQHTYDSDLHISLVAPDGTEVVLSANRGGSGMNFGTSCATRTVFSDHATNAIASGTAPFVGTFRPETPLSALWGRTGPDVNGVWTLKVADGVEADTGTLLCWTLSLAPTVCYEVGNPCLVPPELVQSPGSQVATNGDTVLFTAIATGTEPLHYIWLFNETNTLPATGATLSLTNLLPEQAGTYTVVVSNFYGTATSSPTELTVFVRPFIATQPSDLVATNGDTVVFTVAAGGTEPLTYQWFFDGTNALSEGTNPTLVLTNVNLASSGTYTVRVDNDIGRASSAPAMLTVLVGPGIAVEPVDLVVTNGEVARLEVEASGSEPLTYQWWHQE
ncbi:MAG: immunoglobulin domain-containing protein, partial [Verrucomicrobia bacterium]|nr:immunoglobulin domain-containing protein [Verrucomicrobiota bacterium]